jgi:hypothetical protein
MMRSTTVKEDSAFLSALSLENALEIAAEHIAENFPPEDVYTREQLVEWALDNGFVEKEEEE